MYYVILPPSTMEDAGRFQLMGSHRTREEAEARTEELAKQAKGYYSKSSFRIAKDI